MPILYLIFSTILDPIWKSEPNTRLSNYDTPWIKFDMKLYINCTINAVNYCWAFLWNSYFYLLKLFLPGRNLEIDSTHIPTIIPINPFTLPTYTGWGTHRHPTAHYCALENRKKSENHVITWLFLESFMETENEDFQKYSSNCSSSMSSFNLQLSWHIFCRRRPINKKAQSKK